MLSSTLGLGYTFTYDTADDRSPGIDALRFERRATLFTDFSCVLSDSSIESLEQTTYDRRLISNFRAGTDFIATPKISLRPTIRARGTLRRAHTEEQPRKVDQEIYYEGLPSLDVTFITDGNLEAFVGTDYIYSPEHSLSSESSTINYTTTYGEVSMFAPRLGVIKRGSFGQGGFYYREGASRHRPVSVEVDLDHSVQNSTEKVFSPTTIAVLMAFNWGASKILTEFNAVEASEGGPTKPNGDSVRDDYMVFRFGISSSVLAPDQIIDAMIVHRTLSYARSEDIDLDSMPMSTLHLKLLLGKESNHLSLGLIYGYGRDRQSVPSFNADYKTLQYGLSAGLRWAF